MTSQTLSPAAQAIWNAYLDNTEWEVTQCELKAIAAALHALADQVVPERIESFGIRAEILAIAAELEGGR